MFINITSKLRNASEEIETVGQELKRIARSGKSLMVVGGAGEVASVLTLGSKSISPFLSGACAVTSLIILGAGFLIEEGRNCRTSE